MNNENEQDIEPFSVLREKAAKLVPSTIRIRQLRSLTNCRVTSIQDMSWLESYAEKAFLSENPSSTNLIEEYSHAANDYPVQIVVRGDGNCFYRAFIIVYLLKSLLLDRLSMHFHRFLAKTLAVKPADLSQFKLPEGYSPSDICGIVLDFLLHVSSPKIQLSLTMSSFIDIYNARPEADIALIILSRLFILREFNLRLADPTHQQFIEESQAKRIPALLIRIGTDAEDVIIPFAAAAFQCDLRVKFIYQQSRSRQVVSGLVKYGASHSILTSQKPPWAETLIQRSQTQIPSTIPVPPLSKPSLSLLRPSPIVEKLYSSLPPEQSSPHSSKRSTVMMNANMEVEVLLTSNHYNILFSREFFHERRSVFIVSDDESEDSSDNIFNVKPSQQVLVPGGQQSVASTLLQQSQSTTSSRGCLYCGAKPMKSSLLIDVIYLTICVNCLVRRFLRKSSANTEAVAPVNSMKAKMTRLMVADALWRQSLSGTCLLCRDTLKERTIQNVEERKLIATVICETCKAHKGFERFVYICEREEVLKQAIQDHANSEPQLISEKSTVATMNSMSLFKKMQNSVKSLLSCVCSTPRVISPQDQEQKLVQARVNAKPDSECLLIIQELLLYDEAQKCFTCSKSLVTENNQRKVHSQFQMILQGISEKYIRFCEDCGRLVNKQTCKHKNYKNTFIGVYCAALKRQVFFNASKIQFQKQKRKESHQINSPLINQTDESRNELLSSVMKISDYDQTVASDRPESVETRVQSNLQPPLLSTNQQLQTSSQIQ